MVEVKIILSIALVLLLIILFIIQFKVIKNRRRRFFTTEHSGKWFLDEKQPLKFKLNKKSKAQDHFMYETVGSEHIQTSSYKEPTETWIDNTDNWESKPETHELYEDQIQKADDDDDEDKPKNLFNMFD